MHIFSFKFVLCLFTVVDRKKNIEKKDIAKKQSAFKSIDATFIELYFEKLLSCIKVNLTDSRCLFVAHAA